MAKILIIDDDVDLVEMTQLRLESNGFEVIKAHDGLQATKLAHNEQPNCIIIDLLFPAGGGLTTLRNLKMSSNTKAIPVFVISGTGDENLKEEVMGEDIEGFIEKPYDANDLVAKIKAATTSKESQ